MTGGCQSVFTSVFPIRISPSVRNWNSWTTRSATVCKCGNLKGLQTHLRPTVATAARRSHHQSGIRPATGDVICHKVRPFNKNTRRFLQCFWQRVAATLWPCSLSMSERVPGARLTYSAPLKVTIRLTIYARIPMRREAHSRQNIKKQASFFATATFR